MAHPIVVMGVSGSGKSTVGAALAGRLRGPFEAGDGVHPPENVEKMSRGVPLDEADRWPWLERVGEWLAAHEHSGGLIACGGLRRKYRDQRRQHGGSVEFIHLEGGRDLIERRQ